MLKEIETRREQIVELCRRHGVRCLELFGSAARGSDFDPARSDIDFLVEFDPDQPPALADFFELQRELGELLSRPVDLITRGALENSRNYIRRQSILREVETVYG